MVSILQEHMEFVSTVTHKVYKNVRGIWKFYKSHSQLIFSEDGF